VLQHRFWDLTVTEERFEVKLTFDGIPERLSVPFAAVKVFFDPSVPYGLQFEESEASAETSDGAAAGKAEGAKTEGPAKVPVQPALRSTEKKPRAVRKPRLEKPADDQGEAPEPKAPIKAPSAANSGTAAASSEPKVVSLDKFRKK
jgi:uncharacterized protein